MKIKEIRKIKSDKPIKFYDIEVEKYHNFCITDNNIITHNSSMEGSIIAMAQDFVGTNNLNLILSKGQFGSRLKGGEDSAASRYIFTKLNDLTHLIFRKEDNDVLTYSDDDGFPIEPIFYVPIIPMILVNGASGIGSGYSTSVPSYNPIDIINYLQNKLKGKKNISLEPYYRNFKGTINFDVENNRYVTRGLYNKVNEIVYEIKELPIGSWNDKYYDFLDELSEDKRDKKGNLMRKAFIRDWVKNGNDKDVDIKIYFYKDVPSEFFENVYKNLNLETYVSLNNMHLFDDNKTLKKFINQYEIVEEFSKVRLKYYDKRKNFQLEKMEKDIEVLKSRMRFIKEVVDGKLIINKRTRESIEKDLVGLKFLKINDSYSYLLNMSILSFTKERLIELKEEHNKMEENIEKLKSKSLEEIWMDELNELKKMLK